MSRRLSRPALAGLFALFLLGMPVRPAAAANEEWRWRSGGPYGAPIRVVIVDPDEPGHLWAVTPVAGIFETENEGEDWQRISAGLTNPWGACRVTCLAVDGRGERLLAGTRLSGLFASHDGGRSWKSSEFGFDVSVESISAISIDQRNAGHLLVGTNSGLFRSVDGGVSFYRVDLPNTEQVPGNILMLERHPADPSRVFASVDRAGLFASLDGGISWIPAGDGLIDAPTCLAFDSGTPGRMWAGGTDGIHRWEPLEHRWIPIGAGIPRDTEIRSLCYVTGDGGGLFAGGRQGHLFRSVDQGDTWERLAEAPPQPGPCVVKSRPAGGVYFCGAGGLFYSADGGHRWTTIDGGIEGVSIRSVTPLAGRFGHLLAATGIGLFKSEDFGETWHRASVGLKSGQFPVNALGSDPRRPGRVSAATEGGLVVSDDGGDTWRSAPLSGWIGDVLYLPDSRGSVLASVLEDDATILYGSEDDGAVFVERLRAARDPAAWLTLTTQGDLFFFAKSLYRSTDSGRSWEMMPNPPGIFNFTSVSDLGFGSGRLLAGTEDGLYHSEDRGATWSRFALAGKRIIDVEIHRLDPGWIAVLTDSGLFLSIDGGRNWSPVPLDGIQGAPTGMTLDPSRDFLYLTVDHAVYTAAIPHRKPGNVESERIHAAPNPFTAGTRISFELREAARGDLSLFSVNGDLIRQFRFNAAAGRHEISWDGLNDHGERIPNGVYIVVVRTATETWRGKLIKIG